MSIKRTNVNVRSLRDALALLREIPGQLEETDVPVDPAAELSGVYRYVGAGGTVQRPTHVDGPAMVFHSVKGFGDASVAIGVLASRARVALLLGCGKEDLGHLLCETLRALQAAGVSTHLILTRGAEMTLRAECGMEPQALDALCARRYAPQEIGAAPASGSFRTMGMIVVPASMKTIAGIASGYSDNLLLRAADVTLKERRRLVLLPRECPLSTLHLRNLLELSRMGAVILPPVLSYYQHPQTIGDMARHIVGKALDLFDLPVPGFTRWAGMDE